MFGIHPWLARLPAMLSTLGSLLLVAWVARRRFGNEGAAWAAAIFLTSPLVVVTGKVGTLDALLAVHVFAALALDMAEPNEAGPYRGAAVGRCSGWLSWPRAPWGDPSPPGHARRSHGLQPLRGAAPACGDLGGAGHGGGHPPLGPRLSSSASASAGWSPPWNGRLLDRYLEGTAHVRPPWFYAVVLAVGFLPWAAPLRWPWCGWSATGDLPRRAPRSMPRPRS
jgi:4-amino-4-deoxy-L-arabinose transferase-like glycosyltransferase